MQTYVAKKAASYLSKELKTTISIESLYVKPFKSVALEGLFVQDLDKDTLLNTQKLTVDISQFSLRNRVISMNTVQLDSGKFFLKTYKTGKTNLQFIINYFNTGTIKPSPTPKRKFDITLSKVVLNDIDFKYKNFNRVSVLKRINFDDLHLSDLSTTVENINTKDHLFQGKINNLTFREKSGFYVKNLSTIASIDSNRMEFKDLLLQTQNSRISDYLLLKYNSFKELNQFVTKVHLNSNLNNSYVHTKDIAFFADNAGKLNLAVKLKGKVSGYVNDLRARNFSVSAGQASYLKGNFDLKGLPDINKTYLNLRFDQLYSNKKDLDRLINDATGKANQIPLIASKFGNVSFKGNFVGLIKDFKVKGELKTALGRVVADVKMNMGKVARYAGTVSAYDFNLGELLDKNNLGRTSLTAKINGQGLKIGQLQENIVANLTYFDFNGYRYTNIKVDGKYNQQFFNGKIDVNDRNIKLNFLGGINFTSSLPTFNFNARLRQANLHKLGFIKDTVQIDADFHTAFTGDKLNNIQGDLQLSRIRMTTPEHSLVIDSVYLAADGLGNNRSLTINSDILDAGIQGQYDLNTLPYYFTSVVKQYIPSLQTKNGNRGVQNFNFTLNLKYFEPISLLLIPKLKIPEGAEFTGRFVSAENVATLTGYSSLIEYGNIKVHNLIFDEATQTSALNVFLTSDRIDLNDNLYIKNINMANIFRNDSLSFNVKLSDKDAINQLDLNGLVEFDTENFASLSLLPSDVVINTEVWRIPEQVKLSYNEGKIAVDSFSLSRDNQFLTLDGIISADPADKLHAGFKQFKLSTFNPITTAGGVTLAGELNGSVILSSVTKTPRIESDLAIDSLVMNAIPIGDLTLIANLDNQTRLVDLVLNIQKDGKETMNIAGNYNANSDKNLLNLDLVMDNSELVIFQPFIKNLVSNVSGNISAALKVTGSVFSPEINGTARLKDAGVIINYLKTPYRINDDFTVSNSIIELENLELTDPQNNKAFATGTVNMQKPTIPTIDIDIKATNFMALNTTSKDNPLYYGTAYATGDFSFRGPTNNMRINIDAKTESGTIFNIPLNSASKAANTDFITFVSKDSLLTPKKEQAFNGLEMTLNLEINEASQVNILTDLGNLNGRGKSELLTLKITSLGDFEMYGTYFITVGEFQYTAQEYISKIFEIRQGGMIRWSGDPVEAEINLKAVYGQRTSLQNLYIAAGYGQQQDQSVMAEAVMSLTGVLTQPKIDLDVNFPQDSYVKDELQSYFNDANNRFQQAVNLIVRRSFAANTGINVKGVNQTVISTVAELGFNKFNNIVAQTLNLKSVDFNVRSFNEASASVRLFNNRFRLSGGITDTRAGISYFDVAGTSVARDVEAQYFIKKDGSLVARASNRLNNRVVLNTNQEYVSAIGLVYRKDFDTMSEFFRALIGKSREEERQPEIPTAPPVVPPTSPATPASPSVMALPATNESKSIKKIVN